MRVKITSKSDPDKPSIIGMDKKTYDFLIESRKIPDAFKKFYETRIILETDDIYVVKEEKLYKARNKLTNGYLCKKYDCWAEAFRFKKEDGEALTKEIWEELGVWDNKVYEMEEVEE